MCFGSFSVYVIQGPSCIWTHADQTLYTERVLMFEHADQILHTEPVFVIC